MQPPSYLGPVMTPETVLAEHHDDGVLVLKLNRPTQLNALTRAMERRYFELLDEADRDRRVRAVVVTGAGRAFCSGADLVELDEILDDGGNYPPREVPFTSPLNLRKPLIGAVNGAAAGIGFVQMLLCDVLFVATEAKLTTAFSRRGLVAEQGIAWLLTNAIGPYRAADLLLSSRVVTGVEAERMGLCNQCLPAAEVLPEALTYARELSRNCDPFAMSALKRQLHKANNQDFNGAVGDADRLLLEALNRPGFAEGVRSFKERRAPEFEPLPTPTTDAAGKDEP